MRVAAGVVLLLVGGLAWIGQALSALAPALAERLGLTESPDAVDEVFHADIVGEARWDTVALWPLVLAGVMLLADDDDWAIPGLAGGAIYAYFGGRGLMTRVVMLRRGHRIGSDSTVRTALAFLALWLVVGLVTGVAAAAALR